MTAEPDLSAADDLEEVADSADDDEIEEAVIDYYEALSEGNYAVAYELLTTKRQSAVGSLSAWSARLNGTRYELVTLEGVERTATRIVATISYKTNRAAGTAERTCTSWRLMRAVVVERGAPRLGSPNVIFKQPCS